MPIRYILDCSPDFVHDLLEDKVNVLEGDDGVEEVAVVILHGVGDNDQLLVLVLLDNHD